MDLSLNNLECLICSQTKPNQTKITYFGVKCPKRVDTPKTNQPTNQPSIYFAGGGIFSLWFILMKKNKQDDKFFYY